MNYFSGFAIGLGSHQSGRKLSRSFLACFLLLFGACAASSLASPQDAPQPDQTQTIHGIVVNSITHEPIGRALVSSSDNRLATMTDSQGRFEFVLPKNENAPDQGTVTRMVVGPTWMGMLTARKPGFLADPNEGPLNALTGGFGSLGTTTPDHDLTLSLIPEGLILGRVILPSSDGATPIRLQLYKRQVQEGRAHWQPVADTTARANGEFRFAELSPGIYKLFTLELLDRDPETFRPGAPLFGYPPIYFPNANSFAAAATIHISAGKTFHADLSPLRQHYYPIKVPVSNAAPGLPVAINVMPQGHRGPGFSLGYNDQDRTIEGMLPNGTYTLEAAFFGPASSGVATITVRDAAVDAPPMMLVANASISVNVRADSTSAENRATSERTYYRGGRNVNVRLEPAEDFGQERNIGLRPPTGPKDNSLILEGIPPGRYWVRVDPGAGFPVAVSSGGIDLLHHSLAVAAGASAPIEITIRDEGGEIDGTVEGFSALSSKNQSPVDSSAESPDAGPFQALTFVYCVPLPDSSGQFAQAPVGRNGEFNFLRVAPGSYRLLVFPRQQPELEYENPDAMRAFEAKSLVVRLVAGQKEHVRLPLISINE